MTFPQQATLQRQLPAVRELFQRRQLGSERIETLAPLIEHFEIRVPFIGGFSSGKSSLLNALIGEPLLSVAVTAETAVAAEVRHGPTPRFTGHLGDGRTVAVSREQVEDNQLGHLLPQGWLAVEMPSPTLAATPQLVLVDMPGWGSGVEAHRQVVDEYAERSLAYAVVVSAEEGTLRENVRRALRELAVQEKPVMLAVTKAHKRPDADVANVARQLTTEITQLMGRPPLAVAVTSAGKRDVQQLQSALALLQSRAENVFADSVAQPWRGQLQRAAQLMQVLAEQNFKDAEAISADIETFEHKMAEFDQRLQRETQGLEDQIGPMLGAIRLRVDNALAQRLDSLTSRALDGGNISDDIIGTARLVVAEALKEDFQPTMRRYLDRLADALPTTLDFNFDFNLKDNLGSGGDKGDGFRWTDLTAALGPIMMRFTGPIGLVVGSLIPLVARLFDSRNSRQQEEAAEARRRERAKSQVREALTQANSQIEAQLRPVMHEQIQKAKDSIAQTIATERADIERILLDKRRALEQGETEVATQRAAAQADLTQLRAWLAELPPPPQQERTA